MSNSNKKWRKLNPEKARAHWTVSNAIRYGKLTRQPCQVCGNKKSHAHHNDYSKPLKIEWLCHRCHWNKHGWISTRKNKTKPGEQRTRSDAKRPKLLDKAKKMRDAGMSYNNISIKLNCSKGTIYKWINDTDYK